MKRQLWRIDQPERFIQQIRWTCDEDENGCWIWPPCLGWTRENARPSLKIGENRMTTARWVLWAKTGEVQEHARHTCDVGCCCNPEHLLWGTAAQNAQDKVDRGRSLRGERNSNSKLIADQVIEIRKSLESNIALSEKFGVTPDTITNIRAGRSWRHLDQSVSVKPRSHKNGMKTTSMYPGVYRDSYRNKWVAEITINKKKFYLGRYEDEQDAANAYKRALEDGGI